MLAETLANDLIELGLVSTADVVEHGLSVSGEGRRNQNVIVRVGTDRGFFVKSPRSTGDAPLVDHEFRVTRYLRHHDVCDVPEPCGRLGPGAIYRLESGGTLHTLFVQERRLSTMVSRAAGVALARTHRVPPLEGLSETPLPLTLARPSIDVVRTFSASGRELVRRIQAHEGLVDGLERVRASWQPTTFVHGDIKWDNLLARRSGTSGRRTRVVIADWELAGTGDWRWDVGSFLSEYLRNWMQSFAIVETFAPDLLLDQARFPLDRTHRSVDAFLRGYTRHRDEPIDASELMCFAATRLVQSAVEMSAEAMRLDSRITLMIQVAANIFERPDQAAHKLLGIEPA